MSTSSHCPYRQSKNLLDALASNKTKVAFLLGAGCPASIPDPKGDGERPLIPAIRGLTEDVKKQLSVSENHIESFDIIRKRFSDQEGEPTIEDILSHIRALQEVVRDGDIHGLTKSSLNELDAKICEITTGVVGAKLPETNTPYHQLAKWINGIPREQSVEVFTPNYDLLIEQAFEALKVPYFDGFVGSKEAFFDLASMEEDTAVPAYCLPVRWSRLWKLHGSINWWGRYEEIDNKKNLKVVRTGSEKPAGGDRQMIYPSHLKYDESRRLPYLAMLDRLKNFLARGQAVLVTNGYSFADQHLNEVIFQGLRSNPTAICFGLLYGPRSGYSEELIKKQMHPNLNLLASDGAVLGTIERDWTSEPNKEHVMHGLSVVKQESTESEGESHSNCEFQLGDFKNFGDFLEQRLSRFDDESEGGKKGADAT